MRGQVEQHRRHRRHQPEVHRTDAALVADSQRHVDREVAAGALADDGEALGVAAEARRVFLEPVPGRLRILVRSREAVFRRLPVMRRDHDRAGAMAEARGVASKWSMSPVTKPPSWK